uniref:Golgi SNAP receptor complex member 2 n=1 Tax=Syphacia muris TaxID=451379 RepID=A0A0N5AIZ2_9BILA
MEVLYSETNALVGQVQSNLGILENSRDEAEAQKIIQSINEVLKVIERNCNNLEFYVGKEPPNRRRTAKCKVDQLKYDCQSLSAAASNIHTKLLSRWRAISEREELLTRRFRPNEPTHLTLDDSEIQLNDRLHSSNIAVDELISHGSAVLDQIRSQGFNLRGVRRRIADITQQLGLSSTTLRFIQRRISEDKVVFVVGCIFVLLFMYVFYRYWKNYKII